MKTLIQLLVVATLFLSLTVRASADGPHPGYLHALSDLRMARFLLQRDHPGPRDQYAIDEIDYAIREIKEASIDDGKNLNDHPAADGSWNEQGRFHKALEMLDQAHHDVSQFEDNLYAQGLQHRALEHIDRAHRLVRRIIDQW